jgi:hypothetical protein
MKNMRALCAGFLLMAGGALLFGQASGGAYIRETTGTVEIKPASAAEWVAARAGDRISADTIISTGFKSTASISVGNSILTVRPLTRLSLEELQLVQGNETVRINLQTGRLRADVNPPSGFRTDFAIRAPSATASVRGTSFEFDGVNLSVDEGRVHVAGGNGGAVYVGAGHSAVSDPRTGRTAGAQETILAELIPALPAAADGMREPAALLPGASNGADTPDDADMGFGFGW